MQVFLSRLHLFKVLRILVHIDYRTMFHKKRVQRARCLVKRLCHSYRGGISFLEAEVESTSCAVANAASVTRDQRILCK